MVSNFGSMHRLYREYRQMQKENSSQLQGKEEKTMSAEVEDVKANDFGSQEIKTEETAAPENPTPPATDAAEAEKAE
jgi:hypothetical protein